MIASRVGPAMPGGHSQVGMHRQDSRNRRLPKNPILPCLPRW